MKLIEDFMINSVRRCFVIGFNNSKLPLKIKNLESIENVPNNSVVLIDEGSIVFSSRDSMKERNKILSNIMAIARHKNLSLILIVQNTAMIDLNVLRLADTLILKQPSLLQSDFERPAIKKIYDKVIPYFKDLEEKIKYFYIYDDDFNGLLRFELPSFWNKEISNSFRDY